MLFALIALHALGAAVVLLGGRAMGRAVWLVAALPSLAVVGWLLMHASSLLHGHVVEQRLAWIPQLGLAIDLRVDAFSALMLVLVSGIGVLVHAYARQYFGDSARAWRAAGLLTAFSGAMFGVVVADNLLALFVFWELTSITSYLLIGLNDRDARHRAAAQHAFLVTGLGGLVMLAGLVLLGQQADTYRLSELLAAPPTGTVTSVALVLVLIGAFTKSAQYPFHSWLPGAMVAATPISAYLHSAAMVKAGVYVVARFAPAFADAGVWRPLVVTVGLVTMIAGGLRALRPFDLKQLLAFGTIGQLGFLVVLFGIGRPEATAAGCALILAHGLFKAALFMVVGIVDHETGTRDIRELPVLRDGWTTAKVVAIVSAASMAALPPFAGFIAKEKVYDALIDGSSTDRLVLVGVVVGSVLTVAYSIRFVLALVRPDVVAPSPRPRPIAHHAPTAPFLAPAVVLAVATTLLGVVPAVWSHLVDRAANALDVEASAHLQLWHGVNAALVLSAVTIGLGVLLVVARRQVAAAQHRLAPRFTGSDVYDASVRGLLRFARRLTGVVQPGSLPVYAGIVLATAALAPAVALVSGPFWNGLPDTVGQPAHLPIAALLVVGAVAATVTRRRFAAAILLGIVGYAMAFLFVVQGAPDLALTQFGVESLIVVVFLVVMRRLPDRFEQRTTGLGRAARLAVAGSVGAVTVLLALSMAGARTAAPISGQISASAYDEGFGRNVVNVVLVDVRGLDTLGEITVLVAAAIGIAALVRARLVPRTPPTRSTPTADTTVGDTAVEHGTVTR